MCECNCWIWYVWTSSRYFPREKLIKMKRIKDKGEKRNIYNGVEVCMSCYNQLIEKK